MDKWVEKEPEKTLNEPWVMVTFVEENEMGEGGMHTIIAFSIYFCYIVSNFYAEHLFMHYLYT